MRLRDTCINVITYMVAHGIIHSFLHKNLIPISPAHIDYILRPNVGSKNDNGILEVYLRTFTISHLPVVKQL